MKPELPDSFFTHFNSDESAELFSSPVWNESLSFETQSFLDTNLSSTQSVHPNINANLEKHSESLNSNLDFETTNYFENIIPLSKEDFQEELVDDFAKQFCPQPVDANDISPKPDNTKESKKLIKVPRSNRKRLIDFIKHQQESVCFNNYAIKKYYMAQIALHTSRIFSYEMKKKPRGSFAKRANTLITREITKNKIWNHDNNKLFAEVKEKFGFLRQKTLRGNSKEYLLRDKKAIKQFFYSSNDDYEKSVNLILRQIFHFIFRKDDQYLKLVKSFKSKIAQLFLIVNRKGLHTAFKNPLKVFICINRT